MCTIKYKKKTYKEGDYVIITNPKTDCFSNIPIFRITSDSRVVYDQAHKEKCIIITNDATNQVEAAIDIKKLKGNFRTDISKIVTSYQKVKSDIKAIYDKVDISAFYRRSDYCTKPYNYVNPYDDSRTKWLDLATTRINNLNKQLNTYEQILHLRR